MALLYSRGIVRWDDDGDIDRWSEFSTVFPEEPDGFYPHFSRLFHCSDAISGIAAGRKDEQNVSGIPKSFQLAREDIVERMVVSYRRYRGSIDCESDGWQTPAFPFIPPDEFRCDMLSIGRTSAIPADEELLSIPKRPDNQFRRIGNAFDIHRERFLYGFHMGKIEAGNVFLIHNGVLGDGKYCEKYMENKEISK